MKLNKLTWLFAFLSALTLFSLPKPVAADSHTVPLQVLKAGTNQTSYAASYFAHSATVTSNGNGVYTVTSTVTTSKKLGSYPVQMLNIDGSGVNVTKSADAGSDTITYSFQTNDLKRRHNAVIKVDINNMNYHHVYNVGLVMDTSSLPKDEQTTQNKAQAQTKQSNAKDANNTNNNQSNNNQSNNKQSDEKNNSNQDENSSDDNSQPAASSDSDSATVTQQGADDADFMKKALAIVGGGLGLGIIAAGLTIWFKSRK
ncbi:heme-binding NEAT domain protein [Weissella uvarum]|uniref:NEAT domain-containing protein n=1 Tax=Weissella uvarum TaxID=1479233 RepID=UPI0019607382|nr:NEAT domain-containing protein [Weissella uvarum]MBM7616947.1 heme-binding NEAT domain protein [Weissella uvarum]MCM0594604.1 NEAT domain-containing protein [Weissella uvarum]